MQKIKGRGASSGIFIVAVGTIIGIVLTFLWGLVDISKRQGLEAIGTGFAAMVIGPFLIIGSIVGVYLVSSLRDNKGPMAVVLKKQNKTKQEKVGIAVAAAAIILIFLGMMFLVLNVS